MASVPALREPFDRYPIAREAMIAVSLVVAFAVWIELSGDLARDVLMTVGFPSFGSSWFGFALHTAVLGALTVVAMLPFAAGYVYLRDVDLRIGHLDRTVLGFTAGGLLAGAGLIALVKVLATATGTTVSEITNTGIAADAGLAPVLAVTAIGLLVSLPAYLLVTHLFVQRSIERATGGVATVALTTVIVGAFGPIDLITPDLPYSLVVTAIVVVAIALPAVAAALFDRRWLTALAALPIALLLAGIAVERITDVAGVADGLYTAGEIVVVAVGVAAYQRTKSLLPSALAYVSFVVAADLVVYFFEAGVGL